MRMRIKRYPNGRVRNLTMERGHNMKSKYGITLFEFRKMKKPQKNRCAICRQKETFVDYKTKRPRELCIDHDHKTKKIRKLLCWRCNLGMGIFGDSASLLQKASEYLKRMKGTR